ncbi:helix-turn-helix domain-containing protein [Glycomyces sp. NPDC047010]|uniref:helix-turn-helix domain-containing protein n=1 Tax=Glycomyces sp. NPDC047010 TaxID=3155023 RepID=UPI0033ECC52F
MLQTLGVSESDEALYRALLRSPGSTADELAEARCEPVAAVRRGLHRLEELGMTSRLTGSPLRFQPTRPDVAVDVLVALRRRELAETEAAAQSLMDEIAPEHRAGPEELVEIVQGRQAVAHRFLQLEQSVTEELLVLDRPPYSQSVDQASDSENELLARGVTVRGIYAAEGLEEPGRMAELERLVAAGEQARVSRLVPMKLAVADRSVALLPLSYERITEQAMVVRGSTLVDALVALFEVLWPLSLPLHEIAGRAVPDSGGPVLDEPGQRLLSLLAAGLSDKAIARELAISPRTLSRQLAVLTEALGARTRFQAGAQARERGLI